MRTAAERARCPVCGGFYGDGEGPGFVARHLDSDVHLRAVERNQHAARRAFVPWEAIEVTEELTEEEERMSLRAELEKAQAAYDRDERERAEREAALLENDDGCPNDD